MSLPSIRVDELADFVAGEPGALLLDVREPWEVALAAIALPGTGSLHIPMQEIPGRLAEVPAAQPVVCICHHGARSAQVVAFLLQRGHPRVYNLAGGVDAWSTQVDPAVPRY
jgi:rhodanese-related sulfurtransferase